MSRFARSVPVLAELTGLPIFARMQESGQPLPMAAGMYWTALDAAFKRRGGVWDVEVARRISEALRLLSQSRSSRHAQIAPGAMQHGGDGVPTEPLSAERRAYVARLIGQAERRIAQGRRGGGSADGRPGRAAGGRTDIQEGLGAAAVEGPAA